MFGSLAVLYREPRSFTKADTELLSAFGTQASVALENAWAFDRLAQQSMNDAALQDFGRRLLEATTEASVLDDAVDTAARLLQADTVTLCLVSAGTRLRVAASLGWRPHAARTHAASF